MSKNTRFVLIAIIIAIVIALVMAPKKPAEVPVVATPSDGLATTPPAPAETVASPIETAPAQQPGAEVDGVPAGTETTGDTAAPATTTPAPVETTPQPAQPQQ